MGLFEKIKNQLIEKEEKELTEEEKEEKVKQKICKAFSKKIEEQPELLFMVKENESWMLTQDLVNKASEKTKYSYFKQTLEQFKTKELCKAAFLANNSNILYMPSEIAKEIISIEMIFKAIADKCNIEQTKNKLLEYINFEDLSKQEKFEIMKLHGPFISNIENIEIIKEFYEEIAPTLEYYESRPANRFETIDYSPREMLERNILQYSKKEFKEELKKYIEERREEIEIDSKEPSEIIETNKGKMSINVFLNKIFKGESVSLKSNDIPTNQRTQDINR